MQLTHTFSVPASVQDTWEAFNDLEMVAGCFPGATLESVEGDEFTGTCKVKLGPISLLYTGSGKFLERDDASRRFVIEAKGKDKRGNGTAGATVTGILTEAEGGATDVRVETDLAITGKPAQFGRGVIQDVSDKLLGQFTGCLESKVAAPAAAESPAEPDRPPAGEAAAGSVAGAGSASAAGAASAAAPAAAAKPAQTAAARPAEAAGPTAAAESASPAGDDSLDLGATILPVLIKHYGKPVAAAVLVLVVLVLLVRRRRRS